MLKLLSEKESKHQGILSFWFNVQFTLMDTSVSNWLQDTFVSGAAGSVLGFGSPNATVSPDYWSLQLSVGIFTE